MVQKVTDPGSVRSSVMFSAGVYFYDLNDAGFQGWRTTSGRITVRPLICSTTTRPSCTTDGKMRKVQHCLFLLFGPFSSTSRQEILLLERRAHHRPKQECGGHGTEEDADAVGHPEGSASLWLRYVCSNATEEKGGAI